MLQAWEIDYLQRLQKEQNPAWEPVPLPAPPPPSPFDEPPPSKQQGRDDEKEPSRVIVIDL